MLFALASRLMDWLEGRYRPVLLLWLALFAIVLASTWGGWRLLGGADLPAAIALGVAGYLLWALRPIRSGAREWSVTVEYNRVRTTDGRGTCRTVRVDALRRVELATDDSGPWGTDAVLLLFADDAEPATAVPLDAEGGSDFVGWLAARPGFRAEDFAKAIGSTAVARFTIWQAPA